jgi:hypothetical protein
MVHSEGPIFEIERYRPCERIGAGVTKREQQPDVLRRALGYVAATRRSQYLPAGGASDFTRGFTESGYNCEFLSLWVNAFLGVRCELIHTRIERFRICSTKRAHLTRAGPMLAPQLPVNRG